MTIGLRTALVVLALALGCAVPASAQAVCEDCQPLTNELRTLRDQLAEAEASFKSLQGLVAELEESLSQVARKELPGRIQRLEALRGDVLRLMQAVENAETRLRLCQRGCEKPRQPRTDPSESNFVDENLPRAACAKCQPHVDRVLDLQRRRRFVRNQLRSIDNHMSEWAGRMDVAGAPIGGQLLLKDRAAVVGRIDDLTAEISQALAELTACNESCVQEPGGGTTLVTPQTGSVSPPGVTPPPTTCRLCDEAARALADVEARKKLVADELAEYERTEQQNEQRNAEQQQARRDRLNQLKASGQGGGDEAFDLDMEIRSQEYEQKARQEVLGDDPYPKDLQKRLSTLEEEVSDLKKKFEDCQKECKPTEHSQLFRGPLPYVAGGAIALGALLIGGGDAPTVTATGQVPSAPPAAPTAPQPTPTPPPTPAPPQPSCTEFSGTYSFGGTLRMPRSCFFTGTVPYFTSPISGSFVIQLDASCSGTLTTRYPNTWTFMHRVTGVLNGSTLQLRSSGSFTSTQPFGTPFSSTVELMIANNSYSGTETHTSGSCIDIYDLRDNR